VHGVSSNIISDKDPKTPKFEEVYIKLLGLNFILV